jgi:hypothetical protein
LADPCAACTSTWERPPEGGRHGEITADATSA